MAGARGGREADLFGRAPSLALVAADGAPELAVLGAQDHVNRAGLRLRDGRLAALTFGIRHRAEALPCLAAIARFQHAASLGPT